MTNQAVRVLEAVEAGDGTFALQKTVVPWGIEYWRQHGKVVPDDYLEQARPFSAILLGACVRPARLDPGVRSVLADKRPDHVDFVVIRENSEGEVG